MKETGVLALILGLGSYIIGQVTMVTIVFFVFLIIDFLTGIMGSKASGEVYDKKIAEQGVWKKAGYIMFWLLGVLVQLILKEQGGAIGITVDLPVISLAVTFWLLGTEGMSILYNLDRMGVKGIPNWFVTYFDKMKDAKNDTQ